MSRQVRPDGWKSRVPCLANCAHQSSVLPRLPLPSLKATLARLTTSLRPLAASEDEFAATCHRINEFGAVDGPGNALQEVLREREEETDNWLEEWWDDFAYLGFREPLPYVMTPYAGFEPQPAHLPQTPASRAACLTYATMVFRQKLRAGTLSPETINGVELCMDAYRWMFDCCRVPGTEGFDWVDAYTAGNGHTLGHVIVVRKNRFWKIQAQIGDELVGVGDLTRQFQYIYDHATEEYPAIGALTARDRDAWAKNYEMLCSVPRNAVILHEIQSSAFLVSLDDSTPPPENDVDLSRALLHGTVLSPTSPTGTSARGLSSRYMDKPMQIVVFDNAVAGQMGEHSVVDGTHYIHLCNEILAFLADPASDVRLEPSHGVVVTPEPLDFDLAAIPEIHEGIVLGEASVRELGTTRALSIARTSYGRAAIKAFGIGPDGWAQMVLQVAYARLAERLGGDKGPVLPWPVSSLEAAMTRTFYKGRGDSIRVVTLECVAFVRAMLGNSATREDKVRLFKDAVQIHRELALAAGRGQGIDRHLFAFLVAQPPSMPEPALFSDPLYTRAGAAIMFTSSLFSRHVRVYGWGEFDDEGFGIPYMTGFDDYLQFTVTSQKHLPNAEFAEEILRAAEDIYQLFASEASVGQNKGCDVHAKL